jgi:hypothetical protein
MVNRLLSTIFLLIIVNIANCQINVKVENDCLENNTAILSQFLLDEFGESFVSFWLNNEMDIIFFIEVDSLGYVKRLLRVNKKYFDDKQISKFESQLIRKKIRFYICYGSLPGEGVEESRKIIISGLKGINEHIVSPSFPGQMMSLYNYNKEKNQNFTKLNFFKKNIKKFHPYNYER